MPKVSIVIPCYNHGKYVHEAVESVLNQTYQDFEIIIVNDGSTDEYTNNLLTNYKTPKTRIIHTDNQGLASARNNGIKEARGEYILALDADNKITPHYISKAVEVLNNEPEIGVVYAYARLIGEKQGVWEFPAFNERRLLLGNFIEACSVYRKKIWEECNGYDPDMGIMGYEDWDLWLCAMQRDWKFHLIKEVLFEYRISHNSMIAGCNIPENRRHLIRYVCNKHKSIYITNLEYVISEQNIDILNVNSILRDKDVQIENLNTMISEMDFALQSIYNSNGWKALLICYKIRDLIIPINSRRRRLAKIIFNFIKSCFKKLTT